AARTAVATATITRKTGHSTPVEISGDGSIVPAAMRQASRPDDQRWARLTPARARPPTSAYAAGTGTHWESVVLAMTSRIAAANPVPTRAGAPGLTDHAPARSHASGSGSARAPAS